MTVDNNERYDVIGEVKARQLQDIEASRIKGIRGMREMKDILSRETMFLKKLDPQHCMVWERHVSADSEFGNKYPWNEREKLRCP